MVHVVAIYKCIEEENPLSSVLWLFFFCCVVLCWIKQFVKVKVVLGHLEFVIVSLVPYFDTVAHAYEYDFFVERNRCDKIFWQGKTTGFVYI